MKYKVLIGILLVFLMISVASAKDISELTDDELDNLNYFDKVTVVEFDGFNFTIPAGYGHLEDYNINKTEKGVIAHSMFFANQDDEVIMLSTISGDNINLDLDDYKTGENPEKEKINGHEGWLYEDSGYSFFNYIDNDTVIILQAPDDDYFEIMIND